MTIEKKEEKKGKEKRNHNQQGLPVGLDIFFLHIGSAAGTKEVQEPVGEGLTKTQRREKTRKTGANTEKEEKI